MSQIPTSEITEVVDPVGHVQVIYLGPVAPHWECRMVFGDEEPVSYTHLDVYKRQMTWL